MFLDDGTHTNAVHGFMNMFLSFYEHVQPDAIICAFDAGIPKFRLEACKQYKAQRKPMDNELRMQFPIIEEILESMDIPVVKAEGWEGDDVLGTISKKCEDLGFKSLLITGDKDANQLASDLTKIVNMKKGVSNVVMYGPDEVLDKYGIRVDQFVDYLALMGDSSDNIPGVPGIGPKSASKLLQQFESIEGIYENLDKLKGKQLENIRNNKESAYVSRQAAIIARDVPLDVDLENVYFPSFDKDKVSDKFLNYKLKSSLLGVLKLIGEELESDETQDSAEKPKIVDDAPAVNKGSSPLSTFPEPSISYEDFVIGEEAKEIFNVMLKKEVPFAVAFTKTLDDVPEQVSLFDIDITEPDSKYSKDFKNLICAVSDNQQTALFEGDDAVDVLVACVNSYGKEIIVEDGKRLLELLYVADSNKEALITKKSLFNTNFYDISLAAYLLNSSKSEYTAIDAYQQVFGNMLPTLDADSGQLKKNDKEYIKKKNDNIRLRIARRAAVSFALKDVIDNLLLSYNLYKVYKEIELPLTPVLVYMERIGCKIDVSALNKLSLESAQLLDELKTKILNLAGEEFNIDSPKQLGHILFDVLGLPTKKKTKTGYSTNAAVLEELSSVHPLPSIILKYREYAKLKSTYIDALPSLCDDNNIIHTSFHQKKTTTGRLSSSDPNIQNIPTRTEMGGKIRESFITLEDSQLFMTADYSQIELRMLAHLSQDQGLIDAFCSGEDFHSVTAAKVFGLTVSEVDANQRRVAKAVNFGIIYGQQAFGLSQTLHIEMSKAKEMIERYFITYPDVRKYLDDVVKSAYENGFVETIFGRRRYIPELFGAKRFRSFGERTAMNHPMQGSAADVIKLAMVDVQNAIDEAGLKTKCMMQVHDELDFSVPLTELDQVRELVKKKMENAVKLLVPLEVDISIGNN